MPVNKDGSGRRSVHAEVEVPGTPEQVWRAIATAAGISSWFVPTTSEDDGEGVPIRITSNFGPGMESVATVTAWNPPHSFAAETKDLGADGPVIATQWIVEARAGGVCVVRVVHSLFAGTDEWDSQLEGWEQGWPDFFRLLRLYLAHFNGEPCSAFQLTGFAPAPRGSAWRALFKALGLGTVAPSQRAQSSGAVPHLAGTVERIGEPAHPEELLLRLDAPGPGIAHLFAIDMGEQVLLSIRFYLYGSAAAGVVMREEPAWQAWLGRAFPGEPSPSEGACA